MPEEPSSSSSPVHVVAPVEFRVTKDTPIEEVNAHMFPATKAVPNLCFEIPNIVIATDGQHFTFRNGANLQLEHEIEEWFTFDQVKDEDFPMSIQRLSPFIVAGRTVPVLDDKSVPTAADFLSCLGKRTLWQFDCVPLPMKPGSLPAVYEKAVFRCRRVWVTLPPL